MIESGVSEAVEIPPFCGRKVSRPEVEVVREVVQSCRLSRSELAATVCELLDWRRRNGKLKRQECVQWLEKLESLGWLRLPLEKTNVYHTGRSRVTVSPAGKQGRRIVARLRDVRPVELRLVRSAKELQLWKELLWRYHYLGHRVPFGAALRYFVEITVERALMLAGCLQFSSPAWRLTARDRWIGWSDERRCQQLQRIVSNSRFLILPWIEVKYLASHVLSQVAARVPRDWECTYGVRPLLLESFVSEPFRGTCYQAANWICLGQTRGRGRNDRRHQSQQPIKTVWVYPLDKRSRERLQGEGP